MEGVSIIIVNFNSGDLLLRCCQSVMNYIEIEYEIIVSDNFSRDISIDLVENLCNPRVKIIRNRENFGFSKANNIAFSQSNFDNILFLNPDAYFDEYSGKVFSETIRNNLDVTFIYVSGIKDENNQNISKNRHLIPTFKNSIKYLFRKKADYWYIGAFILLKKQAFHTIGGWNEKFFLYGEDLDFFYTANTQKLKIKELPFQIIHKGNELAKKFLTHDEKLLIGQHANYIFYKQHKLMFSYIYFPFYSVLTSLLKFNFSYLGAFKSYIYYNYCRLVKNKNVEFIYNKLKNA